MVFCLLILFRNLIIVLCEYHKTDMVSHWLGISSAEYDSHCGDDVGHTVWEALDGTDFWYHEVNHIHYLILDLGQTYTIKKVRGRSKTGNDPTHVLIYVSDDMGNWGDPISGAISTWQDTDEWQEVDTTDKDGRYIKIEILFTESPSPFLSWGGTPMGGYFSIFDAYGDVYSPPPPPPVNPLIGKPLICPDIIKKPIIR